MALTFNDESSLFDFVVKHGNGVKGLVDSGLTKVPDQFIQPPYKRIDKQKVATSFANPSIDLSELDGPNHNQVVMAVVHAAETLGFFQVVNHGLPVELLESLKFAAHRFFRQPTDRKVAYLKGMSPSSMVWYGTSFLPEKMKALEWKDYVNMIYTTDGDALEFWPDECKEVVLEYIKTSKHVVKRLLQILIENLLVKLDDSKLDTLIGVRNVRMNFYPTCPNPDLTVGVGQHSDLDTLTMLIQDDVGGLYVKKSGSLSPRNEEWIEVPPIHGAVVIHIGDILQILSNGRYKSVEHMVRTTNTVSRVSIPIFHAPPATETIGPLQELVVRDGVARYREVLFQEYKDNLYETAHEGRKSLDFASI